MSMIPVAVMAGCSILADYYNPIAQPGEPGYTANPQHHLRVMFENDSVFDNDCNYSHGSRIDYARTLPDGNAWGVSITQNIYTPETHGEQNFVDEHPYAGYLALGAAYMFIGEDFGASVEFQLGATGNASGARYCQNGLHHALGMPDWDGWDHQVPSEVTFQLSSRQDYRIPCMDCTWGNGWQSDATIFTREALGTAFIRAGVGMSFRYGVNLPQSMRVVGNHEADYGVGLLNKPTYRREDTSYFLIASLYVEYVARDITIDGGVFHHFEQSCSRRPWQVEAQLGVGISHGGIDYFAGAVYHSDTYRRQDTNGFYGTFSGTWHW